MVVFRRFAAVFMVMAFTAAPVLATWCAANCETVRTSGMPSCHDDTTAAMTIISPGPVPCGHDHHPIAVDVASANSFVPRAVVAVYVSLAGHAVNFVVGTDRHVDARAPTVSPPPLRLVLASTLRV